MKRTSVLLAAAALVVVPAVALAAGHVEAQHLMATLDTEQEVPAPAVPDGYAGMGEATVDVNVDDTIHFEVTFSGLTGPATMAHIHWGAAGSAGPPIFWLTEQGVDDSPSPLSGTLTPDDFTPAEGGPQTFEEALEEMAAGNTYVNIHTAANGPGEIRGQLMARDDDHDEDPPLPDTHAHAAAAGASTGVGPTILLLAFAGLAAFALGLRRFDARRA